MRIQTRFLLSTLLILIFTLLYLSHHPHRSRPTLIPSNPPRQRSPQKVPPPYLKSASRARLKPPHPAPPSHRTAPAHLVIKSHLPSEHISWLARLAPEWENVLLPVPGAFVRARGDGNRNGETVDKGRVVSAFLGWIVENYERLPGFMVFLAPSSPSQFGSSRTTQEEIYGMIAALQAVAPRDGFVPLPCPPPIPEACERPFHEPPRALRTLEVRMGDVWSGMFNQTLPRSFEGTRTESFAVSREAIRARGWGVYAGVWTWVQRSRMDDESAGRVVEGVWGYLFGRGVSGCWDVGECEAVLGG